MPYIGTTKGFRTRVSEADLEWLDGLRVWVHRAILENLRVTPEGSGARVPKSFLTPVHIGHILGLTVEIEKTC